MNNPAVAVEVLPAYSAVDAVTGSLIFLVLLIALAVGLVVVRRRR
ncbi:MAG TPA: hypothetical protein VFN97_04810 [Actinospica sp.]|nr:hypothetical protein [Actinospica sp.]